MCGIIGMVNKGKNGFSQTALNAFNDLLFMDTLRGPDSTGVALVNVDGDVSVLKDSVSAPEFYCTKEYNDVIDAPAYKTGKALIGHNRKATVGKIVKENAHPFVINDEFVLVHNGSLTSHKHLGDAVVDSNAIAQYLHDKWNDDDTPEQKAEVLAHIGGAWALVWYDLRSNRLNIVRNPQRPLSWAETSTEFFFGSEQAMLLAGLSRNNLKPTSLQEVATYKVYSFNLGDDSFSSKVEEVDLPTAPFIQKVTTTTTPSSTKGLPTTTGETDESLSKNGFKKYVKNMLGKTIPFFVEDFVSTDNNNPNKWNFYGQSFSFQFNHEIVGVTSSKMAEEVMESYNCAEGKVIEAKYNKDTRLVSLTVSITGAMAYNAVTSPIQ